ncbi:hypothetical protein Tco_0122934 [Tanacetum coccineum]
MRLMTMSSFDIIKMKSRRSWEDHHLTDEDGDTGMGDSTGVSVSLGGEISSWRNLENQTSGEIDSEDKRSLVKSSEESREMFLGVTRE